MKRNQKFYSPFTPYGTPFILCKLLPNLGIQTSSSCAQLISCQWYSLFPFFGIPTHLLNSEYFFSHVLSIFAQFCCSTQSKSFTLCSLPHGLVLILAGAVCFKLYIFLVHFYGVVDSIQFRCWCEYCFSFFAFLLLRFMLQLKFTTHTRTKQNSLLSNIP